MTIEQLLEHIKELQGRQQKGEDVSQELTKALGELEELKQAAQQGGSGNAPVPPEDNAQELARLRAEASERAERQAAEQAVKAAVAQVQQQEQQRAERVKSYALDALKDALGGTDLASAVDSALKTTRGGSRFAGPGADEDVAALLAAGGSVKAGQLTPGDGGALQHTQVGEHRGVKAIEERKNLAEFFSIIARAKQGPMFLDEAEQAFLRKQWMDAKAMAQGTDSAGGFAVPQQWMPDILKLLRANAVVRRANPRIVQFNKQMNQITISSGSAAYYTAENAQITPSGLTLAQAALLTPHYLTGLVPVSNVLLSNWTGAPDGQASSADQTVRDDLTEAISTREDLAFLQGAGSGGEPVGLRSITGRITNPITPGANGFLPTLPQFRTMVGATRLVGPQNPRWTWFFHPALLTYLETLTDTLGRFLVDTTLLTINDDGVSGTFLGLPFFASYQIPTNITLGTSTNVTYVMLVNMADTVVGEEQSLQLAVSDQASYSPDGGTTQVNAFQQNQTLFRAIIGHDINHRRPSVGIIDQEGIRLS